jgi:transglutaminase-like putative cysteine protease
VRDWPAKSQRASDQRFTAGELHLLRWGLGGVLALVSVWGVFFFELSGGSLLAPVTVLLLAALARPRWTTRLPPLVWRLLFPGLILFVATDLVLNGEPLAALLRLNILLVTVRAVGPRRTREDLQLVVLGLFLVVVAGVLTVAIGFALHILLFTALALTYLLTITLSDAAGPEAEPDGWLQVGWRRLFGRLWRQTDWRVVGAAAALYLLVVVLASVLFMAMPRFQIENSLGFLQLHNRRSYSGFSETVKLGEVTEIALDTSTALRAELSDPTQVPALPYWRMVALDEYRDGTFRASRGLIRRERDLGERRELHGWRAKVSTGPVWTFYYEAGVSRYLPLTGDFNVMRLREARAVKTNLAAHTLALRTEPQSMFAYRVEGLDLTGAHADGALRAELAAAKAGTVADYPLTLVAVPEGEANARVLDAILAEVTGGARLTATEFIPRALDHLERNHRYALHSSLPGGAEDPLVRWLAGATPGHCELFAGGFALLARRAGFPVRVVTGFKGGAWNAFEQYYMVRNSDAHAWCELLDESGRWVRVDPTPGASAEATALETMRGRAVEVDSSWKARLDALRMLWYRRIVDFDRKAQDEAVDALKSVTRSTGQALIAWVDRHGRTLRDWVLRPWNFRRIASWAGVCGGGIAAVWLVWRWRQLWWLRWLQRGKMDPVRREAGRWLRRMARVDLPEPERPVWQDLQRLRYGPAVRGASALAIFRRAKRAWRKRR